MWQCDIGLQEVGNSIIVFILAEKFPQFVMETDKQANLFRRLHASSDYYMTIPIECSFERLMEIFLAEEKKYHVLRNGQLQKHTTGLFLVEGVDIEHLDAGISLKKFTPTG